MKSLEVDMFSDPSISLDRAYAGFQKNFPGLDLIRTPEIVYSNNLECKEGKNIIIIGGGPSSLEYDGYDKYDEIWSMNHYYKSPLAEYGADLMMLSPEVYLGDRELLDFISVHNPYVGFEWNGSIKYAMFFHYFKLFVSHTRFYSKLGYGVRMIILAAELGAKSVSFVGLDGVQPILKGRHAFQPNKKILPSGVNASNGYKIFKHQYDTFWEYMNTTFPNSKYISLDTTNLLHEKCSE